MAVMPKVSQMALNYIASFGIDVSLIPEGSIGPGGYELWVSPEVSDHPATEFHSWPKGFNFPYLNDILWEKPKTVAADMRVATDVQSFEEKVHEETGAIASILIEKNKAYGNSALDPVRVFSQATPEEQILVRIDDKLSRIQRGHEFADEDTVTDLIGYLILLKIARK